MKLVIETPSFAVYDDVLQAPAFDRIWQYVQREKYTWVHHQMWLKAWRLSDGSPLAGPVIYSDETTARIANQCEDRDALPPELVRDFVFPTGRHVDGLVETIAAHGGDWTELIGRRGDDWVGFTVRAFLYPQGAGLSWHLDLGRYSGAYIYYAHPTWNVKWGGELMVADDAGIADTAPREPGRPAFDPHDPTTSSIYQPDQSKRVGQHLDNAWENEKLMEMGTGRYVFPKPNRLVIVAPGSAHCINPLTTAAGDKVRATITGFFITPGGGVTAPDTKAPA
ncbi:MAG: 2OG-Fe(II) oxygenase [Proteobacteria bacterium]|nr:2OG-Fe(II) oxygenase [Pseudomonadota bacterium]